MNSRLQTRIGIGCVAGCLCIVAFFLVGAAPRTDAKSTAALEYTTVSTDMKSLPTELNKLGKDGWNVVSTIRHDLVLDQENGKNHIRTARITIVAKRRK